MRSLIPRKKPAEERADPAPSRWSYRFQRLWLTPVFRQIVRVGMPSFLLIACIGLYFSDEQRQSAIGDQFAEIRRSVEERPEFMVKVMSIGGASDVLSNHVREVLAIDLPISSFDLELEALRKRVESLDAVKRVELRVQSGGILNVRIEERVPAVVWRGPDGLELLDADGHRVSGLRVRIQRPDLPLIAGEGAQGHVREALDLLARAEPIKARVLGVVRIAETRWDMVLDRDQRIMLPAKSPTAALDRVLALNEAQELLARDVTHVDFRNGKRPTLRLSQAAVEALKDMRGIDVKEDR